MSLLVIRTASLIVPPPYDSRESESGMVGIRGQFAVACGGGQGQERAQDAEPYLAGIGSGRSPWRQRRAMDATVRAAWSLCAQSLTCWPSFTTKVVDIW